MKDNHTLPFHKKVKLHYQKKFGGSLTDPAAHLDEHHRWDRRNFLKMTGLASLGAAFPLRHARIFNTSPGPLTAALSNSGCGDRSLVLLRLKGGNDGLNTVILRGNDEYYNIRPSLAVQESGLWALNSDFGMPHALDSLQPFWQEGKMKIVHNTGYPEPNYSHFRSSDIWASGSDSAEKLNTGWAGRWLDTQLPAYQTAPPAVPPALQIGVETNLVFRASTGSMALSISNPDEFYQIAQSGELYPATSLNPDIPHEAELIYARNVANSSFRYAGAIQQAFNNGANQANYPDNDLAAQMAIIARLIKGNLGTRIYMVTLDGFDTHASQNPLHLELLGQVGSTIKAFFEDLTASGHAENVLTMTFSEFGRTIFENGSAGTDHGTGAPIMLFGQGIGSVLHGTPPDLLNPGPFGDPVFSTDFRQVYATVLQNWLCVAPEVVDFVLGNEIFERINGLLPGNNLPTGSNEPAVLLGYQPAPGQTGILQLKFSIKTPGTVRLQIHDLAGHFLRQVLNEFREKGSYTIEFHPSALFLPPGDYVLRMDTNGQVFTRPLSW